MSHLHNHLIYLPPFVLSYSTLSYINAHKYELVLGRGAHAKMLHSIEGVGGGGQTDKFSIINFKRSLSNEIGAYFHG